MINLIGEYECKIDGKGRILFPAGLKKQLRDDSGYRFVINRGFEQCLVLYPIDEWKTISEELNRLNLYVKKNREFVRYFYRGATELLLDGSSRLLVPKPLLTYAEIDKDIVLFAFSNRIEVWNRDRYKNLLNVEPDDFSLLAEDVMSKKDIKPEDDVS